MLILNHINILLIVFLFWKDYPYGLWQNHQPNPAKVLKEERCLMIFKGIKDSIKIVQFAGLTLNIGFIGLNFAGGSSKINMQS